MPPHTRLIDESDIALPDLPTALEGLRIAHVTDLHITRSRRRHHWIAEALTRSRADLVALTGDYITRAGQEAAGYQELKLIVEACQPRLGVFGVFGNHDTVALRKRVADLPVQWLNDTCHRCADLPLEIWGADTHHRTHDINALAMARQITPRNDEPRAMRLLLCHMPTFIASAADLDMDLMLSGHTHGGQCRFPGPRALINSCDLPLHLTSGVLRHRKTLAAVSRGLGEVLLPLRVWCGPHLPIYTLRRGPSLGHHSDHVQNVRPW